MARIAALRAEITNDRGRISRLAHGPMDMTLNDRSHGIEVVARPVAPALAREKKHAWTISIRTVVGISSSGAAFDASPIARVTIGPDDLARLEAGTHTLAVVPTGAAEHARRLAAKTE